MPETVNGPEGVSEWDLISWGVHEQNVARLRQRIFTARGTVTGRRSGTSRN